MHAIAYRFHVRPRYRDSFQHAWRAASDSLQHMLGLVSYEMNPPHDRHAAFTLLLNWEDPSSFERFIRTWVGLWMVNGMGLEREAFSAPIQTHIDPKECASRN
jgi:hypothetical protein